MLRRRSGPGRWKRSADADLLGRQKVCSRGGCSNLVGQARAIMARNPARRNCYRPPGRAYALDELPALSGSARLSARAAAAMRTSADNSNCRNVIRAQQRLSFEELLAHYLSLQEPAPAGSHRGNPHRKLVVGRSRSRFAQFVDFAAVPSSPNAQEPGRCRGANRRHRLGRNPMMRLIQGDVGSGKTVVAAISLPAQAVAAGRAGSR